MSKERSPELKRALKVKHTGNSVFSYIPYLDLRGRHLEGNILDMGSGRNNFANIMGLSNVEAYVVGVNPHLIHPSKRKRTPNARNNSQVIALAPNDIPFTYGSFNTILDFLGPLKHLHSEEIIPYLDEMLRLLREGGEYRGYPYVQKDLPLQELLGRRYGNRLRLETLPFENRPKGHQNDPRLQDRLILRK